MESATADRRLEKLEKERKKNRWLPAFFVSLIFAVQWFYIYQLNDLKEQTSDLEDRLSDTAFYSSSALRSEGLRWGPKLGGPSQDGGFGFDSGGQAGLEIYNYSIYGNTWAKKGGTLVGIQKGPEGERIPRAKVRLLDFVTDSESFKEILWGRYWRAQDVFILQPGGYKFPNGIVWFKRGELVYVGGNLDSVGLVAEYNTPTEWEGETPPKWATRDLDREIKEGKGRIFAMPKEGAWTFSIKDGLVRVED